MTFTWHRITNDQVVSASPSKVGSIILTPSNDSKKADITLHDGESTNDPTLLTLRTASGVTNSVNFQPYLQTQRGLYVNVGGDVGEVLIQLSWDKE